MEVGHAENRSDAAEGLDAVPVILRLNLLLKVLREVALLLLARGSLRIVGVSHLDQLLALIKQQKTLLRGKHR